MQRYRLVQGSTSGWLEKHDTGDWCKFSELPLQPVPAQVVALTRRIDELERALKQALIKQCHICKADLLPSGECSACGMILSGFVPELTEEERARMNAMPAELVQRLWDKGEPVPEPLPWLDQPDGTGDWRYIPSDIEPEDYKLVRLWYDADESLIDSCGSLVKYMAKGRWQRIPQPSLPNDLNPPKCQQCKLVIEPWQSIEDHSHGSGDIHDA